MVYPIFLYVLGIFALLTPQDLFHKVGREKLISNFFKVISPDTTNGVLFVEVIIGDVMTSLCKVFADMEVTACVLLTHIASAGSHEHLEASADSPEFTSNEYGCAESLMRPLVTSIPFLIRFYQCWVQYRVTKQAFPNLNKLKK